MKKPRVIVKAVSTHQAYVEHNGERTLYAVMGNLKEAKRLVQMAERELGIAGGGIGNKSEQGLFSIKQAN